MENYNLTKHLFELSKISLSDNEAQEFANDVMEIIALIDKYYLGEFYDESASNE